MWLLKRGWFGCADLRSQSLGIAGLYMIFAGVGIIYGFVMISAPQKIHSHAADEIIEEKIENNIEDEAELKQIAAEIANGTVSPKEMHHYKDGLFRTQKAGMKSLLVCLTSMIVSILLYIGAKHSRSLYFVPWLTEQVIAICTGVMYSVIMAIGGFLNNIGAWHFIIWAIIFAINVTFVHSVISHFILLRKMKRHSKEIIQSVMNGNGYQTTNYDRMTEDIGREMTTVPPIRERDNQNTNRDDVLYFSID